MLSLRPQALPTHTSGHYVTRDNTADSTISDLSTWYSAGISEFVRAAPQIPTHLYGLVTTYLNIINPYPPLPNELIHHIFTVAAEDDKETCRQLCLVSSWTRLMVLPYCMPTVVVKESKHWLFNPSSLSFPRDDWVSPAVFTKNLWINNRLRSESEKFVRAETLDIDFRNVFSSCPNVSTLSATGECLLQMAQQGMQKILRSNITCLTIQYRFEPFSTRSELQSLFANITDLNVSVLAEAFDLSGFPKVSRIRINACASSDERLKAILQDLRQNAQLQAIAIGLPGCCNEPISSEEPLTLADIVTHAVNDDARFSPPSPAESNWKSWQKKMCGSPSAP